MERSELKKIDPEFAEPGVDSSSNADQVGRLVPHSVQNFAPAGFSAPHFGQVTVAPIF